MEESGFNRAKLRRMTELLEEAKELGDDLGVVTFHLWGDELEIHAKEKETVELTGEECKITRYYSMKSDKIHSKLNGVTVYALIQREG